jgi:fido (protein-threonine AMPylation protein)
MSKKAFYPKRVQAVMRFVYPPGATPLDPDEAEGLIPAHITLQRELNEWEELNIRDAVRWMRAQKRRDLLSIDYIKRLHREMFGRTWIWAGTFRTTLIITISTRSLASPGREHFFTTRTLIARSRR